MSHSTLSLEIAQSVRPRPITDVASELGLTADELEPYGRAKAKVHLDALAARQARGKLVLVTGMTPTPDGEGKTTVTIGLAQALRRGGTRAVVALRQPSLGPVLGIKGGGAGGGRSQILPMEDVNLHLTGDMAAIGAAHNLLAALIDNDLHHRGPAHIDPRRVLWRRAMDMNDRVLRRIVVGLGGGPNGVTREDGFIITAASEVMAILCLASGRADLEERLGRLLIAFDAADAPVYARDLGAAGAMAVLLRDALLPNLVQTVEGGPALVHGGPFANIAHGASSLLATRLGLATADVVVTEAGFASELGAEKFFDIVCRAGDLAPQAVVLVATCRALRWQGGVTKTALAHPDAAAVSRGLANLDAHIENVRRFGYQPVIALNQFATDDEEELALVEAHCQDRGVACARADAFGGGGPGCEDLARAVTAAFAAAPATPRFLYRPEDSPKEKIAAVARALYGSSEVRFIESAPADLERVARLGLDRLPICVAKTQAALGDDPTRRGGPAGTPLTVREVHPATGAGFLVVMAGAITTMPGLPRAPAALDFGIDDNGRIRGLY